jgi:hypothetical protein
MLRRILSLGVLGGLLTLGLTGSVLAGGGGGGFGAPGTNSFTDVSANAAFIDSIGFVNLSVDRGMQTFKVKNTSGPPVMMGPETTLTVFVELVPPAPGQPGGFEFGCFVIPDSAFTVASGLASATLNVGPSQETPCPGQLISAAAGGRPGFSAPAPLGGEGGGGGGGSTISSVTVNLTWTSNGVIFANRFTFGSKCLTFVSNAQGDSQSTVATATGTVSPLLTATAILQFGNIAQFDSTQVTTGSLSQACTGGFGP